MLGFPLFFFQFTLNTAAIIAHFQGVHRIFIIGGEMVPLKDR